MSEIIVHHGNPEISSISQRISTGRISLIGCVDLEWVDKQYPLPLFTVDRTLSVKPVHHDNHSIYRVIGLIPTHDNPQELMYTEWEGGVDLPSEKLSGDGPVFLGQGQETTGHIFDRQEAFDPDFELGYVLDEVRNHKVLHQETFKDVTYNLIYAPADVLDNHGRLTF